MESLEVVNYINNNLKSNYGIDTISGQPIWRVVWSNDQFEKRWTSYTDEGFQLLQLEVREYPKYKQWIRDRYLLERLVANEEIKQEGAPVDKIRYESMWVFENKDGNYLPPRYDVCKFVIDSIYAAEGRESLVKYKDELLNESPEQIDLRLNKLQEELFGNETPVGDALAYKEGVSLSGKRFGES